MDFISRMSEQFLHFFDKFKEMSFVAWAIAMMVALFNTYLITIGYDANAETIKFIFYLLISDFVTRLLAQMVKAKTTYNDKSNSFLVYYVKLFFYAHSIKAISSRKFFEGFFTKSISYTILLMISHQVMIDGLAYDDFMSSLILYGLVLYDIISVLENLSEMGFSQANGLLKIFKRKAQDLEDGDTSKFETNVSVEEIAKEEVVGVIEETLVPKDSY